MIIKLNTPCLHGLTKLFKKGSKRGVELGELGSDHGEAVNGGSAW